MEEFVAKVRDNISKQESASLPRKSLNTRNLLRIITSAEAPDIKISNINEEGDILFSVNMKGLGLSINEFNQYKSEVITDFSASIIGELLVRENINRFARIIVGINASEYESIVNSFEHKRFGLEVSNYVFKFSFHVSLLQQIMTEGLIQSHA